MRASLFTIIISILFNSFGFSQTEVKAEDTTILTKEDYSVSYPVDWELNESGVMGTDFILFSPLASEEDMFRENVTLIIQDLEGMNLNLDQYVEISNSQLKTVITDYKNIENKRVKTEDGEYHKFVYTGKQGEFSLKFEQYAWVVGNKAYVLTFTSEIEEFDSYKEAGESILSSFSFTKD